MRLTPALCALVALSGCYASHGRGDLDAGRPDARRPDAGRRDAGCIPMAPGDAGTIAPERVDLLFMVDSSSSMREEQESLALALPSLVQAVSTGDVDLDGVLDFAPVESLHVGVVTADMGTGGFFVPSCANPDFGEDGVLRTTSSVGPPRCMRSYPPFLEYRPGEGQDPAELAAEAACLTTSGTGGCGFEQQLEAVLKAVTPSTSTVRFFMDSPGHGDGVNAGFLREDSVLAVILVTDEDDCSARDRRVFDPSSDIYTEDLNLRCFTYQDEALHRFDRYVDGLIALRADLPGRLVFASIVGVPPDLSGASEATILADPRLEERIDRTNPTQLVPSCDVPGRGIAFTPRRILETSRGIRQRGGRSVVMSICVDDFSPAVRLILDEIAAAAGPLCR